MKNNYTITILGQELSVLSDADDAQVAEVVQYLNKKVDEILRFGNGHKTLNVAILAALNISEEVIKLRETNKKLCEQVEAASEKLIQLIDNIE